MNMIWTRKWNSAGKNDLQGTGTKFYQLEQKTSRELHFMQA